MLNPLIRNIKSIKVRKTTIKTRITINNFKIINCYNLNCVSRRYIGKFLYSLHPITILYVVHEDQKDVPQELPLLPFH